MSYSIYSEIVNPNGNLLFTLEQLNHSSYTEKTLPVKCLHCGKIYYISRKDYVDFLHESNRLKYCSLKCSSNAQITSITKPCLNCGKLVTKRRCDAEKFPNFFCNHSCAASYNNKVRKRKTHSKLHIKSSPKPKRKKDELQLARKKLICTLKKYRTKLKASVKPKVKVCPVCGQVKCAHPDICKSCFFKLAKQPNIQPKLECLGFDVTTIGTPNVYKEAFKMFRVLRKLYCKLELSTLDIQKLIGAKSARSVELLFKLANIKRRSLSESVKCAYKHNKCHSHTIKSKISYKQGWHNTWQNKQIFYRSSYELEYALKLDEQHIEYDCECLRIEYFDSQKQKQRIAIPDFYLSQTNTIVEIKSSFTYDRLEMIDKSKQYKRLGYNFKLILDHKEYDYCPITKYRYKI